MSCSTGSLRAEIIGIARVDGDSVDHEVVEISPSSEIVSDGPIAINLLGSASSDSGE